MRSKDWIGKLQFCAALVATLLIVPVVGFGQESDPKPPKKEATENPKSAEQSGESKQDAKQDEESGNSEQDPEAKSDGVDSLGLAFEKKLNAKSLKDLDAVISLCEKAIKEGLDEERKLQAKQLAATAALEHAERLTQGIFGLEQDKRWKLFRSQAIKRLKTAIEFDPELGEAYILIAKLNALPGGNKKEAAKMVEKAVELAGDDRESLSTALFYRATLAEDEEAQLADLNQAIKINPDNFEALRVRAEYYFRKGEPKKAIADTETWLESGEQNVNNYLLVVGRLMAMGPKFREDEELQTKALEILDRAIELDKDAPEPLTVRAQLNLQREKFEEAIKDAGRALELDSKSIPALMLRATAHSEMSKLELALADVNEALKIRPGLVDGIQMRGIINSQLENFADAIEDIQLLANFDPDNEGFQRQLAMLYNADDRPSKAIKIYDRLVKSNDEKYWGDKSAEKQLSGMLSLMSALRGRGDARLSTGEHAEAVSDYDAALKLNLRIRELQTAEGIGEPIPIDDGILNNFAWVLATSPKEEVRDGKRAIELAKQAAEVTEYKEAHILSTLASGFAESGDFETAKEWLQKAIELNRAAAEAGVDKKRTERQRESLAKELASYERGEAWRELQDVENQKQAEGSNDGKPDEDEKSEGKQSDDKEKKSDDKDADDKDADDKKPVDKQA